MLEIIRTKSEAKGGVTSEELIDFLETDVTKLLK